LEESQAALEQALQKEPQYAEAIANLLVLTVVSGSDGSELFEYVNSTHRHDIAVLMLYRSLKKVDPQHQLVVDLEEKSSLFDTAAAKYSAKVSA
jgi:coatomer protein complex subunit epsilon